MPRCTVHDLAERVRTYSIDMTVVLYYWTLSSGLNAHINFARDNVRQVVAVRRKVYDLAAIVRVRVAYIRQYVSLNSLFRTHAASKCLGRIDLLGTERRVPCRWGMARKEMVGNRMDIIV